MLAVLAMLAALRVAAGGCGLPFPCAARRGLGTVRSGRESRCPDRTGKLAFRRCNTRRRVIHPAFDLASPATGTVVAWPEALAGRRLTITMAVLPGT